MSSHWFCRYYGYVNPYMHFQRSLVDINIFQGIFFGEYSQVEL